MADYFKIVNQAGTVILDLRQSTVFLLLDTWRTAPAGDGTVVETFQIGMTGTDSTLRTNIETLVTIRQRVREFYIDPMRNKSIWLYAYSDGESAKRALILEFDAIPVEDAAMTPLLGRGHTIYQVSVLRLEAWEATATTQITSTENCTGGLWPVNPGSSLYGSLNARIKELAVSPGSLGGAIYRLWIGIQPYYGTNDFSFINSYFDGSWEVEAGTASAGSFVNDATASPAGTSSNCLEVTSVASSLTKVWWSILSNHSASNYDAYLGDWYVLGRMKVDAGVCAVQLRYGIGKTAGGENIEKTNDIVYVSNTNWRLIELGKVSFPPYGSTPATLTANPYSALTLYLQQVSGTTTSFKFDLVILIPARHFVKANKAYVYSGIGTDFLVREDGKLDCMYSDEGGRPEATYQDWEWPWDGGFIVVAGERETSHDLTDSVTLTLDYYTRWLGHRV
jgi:hypothetical protein